MKGERWLLTPPAGRRANAGRLSANAEYVNCHAQWDSWGRLMQAFANTTSLRKIPLLAMHCTACLCTAVILSDPNISSKLA